MRKRLLSLIMAICMVFSLIPAVSAEETPVTVTVAGQENAGYAADVFGLVNKARAEEGLDPYTRNATLSELAMQRAAEIALYFDHTRPDGTNCFTVMEGVYTGWTGIGENIAIGQDTPEAAMNSWMNSTQGHREAILDAEHTQIGIGCFYADGVYCWVQLFGDSTTDTAETNKTGTAQVTRQVNVLPSNLKLEPSGTRNITLEPGETYETVITSTNPQFSDIAPALVPGEGSVTDVNGNTIATRTVAADGTITITAVNPGSAAMDIPVYAGQTDALRIYITVSEEEIPTTAPTEPAPTETEPVETEPVETEPVETEPVETEPVETEPVETEPVETEPVETEPVETEPVETEPVETEPVETEPVETEPVETEPVETEPVETEPVETEPVETEPVETEPVETEPVETEPVETEPVETEPVETEPVETEPVETEPVETEPVETEPVETEPVETEPVSTEPEPTEPSEPGSTQYPDVLIIHGQQTLSDQTINTDVYVTSTGIAVFNNVIVNGDIYCHGQLTVSNCTANDVYAYAYGTSFTCDAFDGTHGIITGSLTCNNMTITDEALDYAFATWGTGEDIPEEPDPTVPSEPDDGIIASGECGENAVWVLDSDGTLTISGTGSIGSAGEDYKDQIIRLVVEEGITGIGNYAFSHYEKLVTVTLPESVSSLGCCAFEHCYSLTSIDLPESMDMLDLGCFRDCTSLVSVQIPTGLPYIGDEIFSNCTSLQALIVPDTVTRIEGNALWGCPNLVIYCYELSYAHVFAIQREFPFQLMEDEPNTPTYSIHITCNTGGTASVTPDPSPANRYVIFEVEPGDDYTLDQVYYLCTAYPEMELEFTQISETQYMFLMPESDVELEVYFLAFRSPFKDVKGSDFFYEPVLWAVSYNITSGVGNGRFAPGDPCTRAQVVTFLWRAAGEPEPISAKNPFTDVKESAYYYKAVLWAVENGITTGTGKGTFSPNSPCTRAQVVTFLWRAAGEPGYPYSRNPFRDVKESAFYYDAVLWAVNYGITTGIDSTHFGPNSTCTRGQVVTFLYRFLR